MSLNLKEMFSGFLSPAKKPDTRTGETKTWETSLSANTDEETLIGDAPYKLEPSLEEVERYLDRIRRHGL